ncbi:PA0069 family radical SAM protein [Marinobacter confluentis]|uniref:PA0069 family radical SAM protein n=1 Tax=Marinobacter confluentis TaxID=1697557 RepID=A0A4Z1BTT7_9GAMM|nr:PA0069 family radical SAM protein [Marinobacter confluentis]TGN40649.1 PA0069 family radical SAM protein [Marinobacter confluentis]
MKTRGTATNPHNRFQPIVTDRDTDDGWYQDPADEVCPDSIATQVTDEQVKSIISRNQSPDVPFDQSINPYRGCEHACVYCFARPTHAYWDMSPGLDFETRLIAKPNAAQKLRETLDKPGYQPKPIALGVNTDAYQPIEKQRRITREVLEVLAEYQHPVSIITKGALILRDLDLLSDMASQGLCSVRVSLTTLDNTLKAKMEPRTAAPVTRLKIIRELSAAGVPTGIVLGPVIPFINDHELEKILVAAAEAGASRASWIMLRLPHELDELFRDWLQRHFPDRAERVMGRIQDLRGGKSYDSTFGRRMTGTGPYSDLIRQRFSKKANSLSLALHEAEPLRTDRFRRPGGQQIALF